MGEILSHPIRELATHEPVTVDGTATLREAAHRLWAADVGALVVLVDGRPAGILSERDIVARLGQGADADATTAATAMTPNVLAGRPEDRVLTAVIDMIEHGFRHLPLIDHAGRFVGMVSMRDLLRPMLLDALEGDRQPA